MKDIYSKAIEVIAWLEHAHHLLGDFEWASTTFKTAIQREFGLLAQKIALALQLCPTFCTALNFGKSETALLIRSCRASNNILSGVSVVQSLLDRPGGSSGEASQSLMWINLVVLERCQMAWNGVFDSLEANRKRSWHARVAPVRSISGLSCLGIPTAPERAYDQLG
jgi:hypothetical protein